MHEAAPIYPRCLAWHSGAPLYFFVDEGGNTGLNLFDPNQPALYYGVLTSTVDLDVAALEKVREMRRKLGVERIHAKDLGNDRLLLIAGAVLNLQRKLGLSFDFYKVLKADHAVMCFFDQVFDSGMNEAVRWTNYWSPLRYALLLTLATVFDEELAKAAWLARIEGNDEKAEEQFVAVCKELLSRLGQIENEQARIRIGEALVWAAKNPEAISYNASNGHLPKSGKKAPALQISPNIVGFQFVMQGIARRLAMEKIEASRIVVDQQSEFNQAQRTLAEFFAAAAGIEFPSMPAGMPTLTLDGMPSTPIEFRSSQDSAGLELVDVLLWTHRRLDEEKPLARELLPLIQFNLRKGMSDEISLVGIERRWTPVLSAMAQAEDPAPERMAVAREQIARENARIAAALAAPGSRAL
jgi:hypothetical protein